MGRILLASLAAVIGLLVIATVALFLLFDPNDYKDYLSDWVRAQTGREFDVRDELQLSFFPWLAIETGGISLGNPPGFTDQYFATAQRLAVRVRLLPLLRREVEVGTVVIDGLQLNLSRNSDGMNNWDDLFVRDDDIGGGGAAPASPSTQSLDIAGITLRDALIFWREDDEVRYILRNAALSTGTIRPGRPVEAAMEFDLVTVEPATTLSVEAQTILALDLTTARYAAEQLSVEFRLEDGAQEQRAAGSFDGVLVYSVNDGTVEITDGAFDARLTEVPGGPDEVDLTTSWQAARLGLQDLSIEIQEGQTNVLGLQATWELNQGSTLTELSGHLRLQEAPLAAALEALDIALPAQATDEQLGNFDLESDFTVNTAARSVNLDNLSGRALDLAAQGRVAIVSDGTISGRIQIPQAPAGRILGIWSTTLPASIDTSIVDTLALSARFQLGPQPGEVALSELSLEVLDATVAGNVNIRADGHYTGELRSSQLSPERFSAAFANLLPAGLGPSELGALAMATRFDYDAQADQLVLDGLEITAFGLQIEGNLTSSTLSDAPRTVGTLFIHRFSPRALLGRFGQPVPETSDTGVLGSATIRARVDVQGERGVFEDIRVELDDSMITGNFTVENFTNPSYQFDLTVDAVNADRYLPPSEDSATSDETTAGEVQVPVDALRNFSLQGRARVGALQLAGMRFDNVSTSLAIDEGLASLESARADLYGGEFEGSFTADARSGVPSLSLTGRASAIGVEPLLVALRGESALTGTGSFDLSLTGTGATVIENVESAAGNIDFALTNGMVRGFNLERALCSTYNARRNLPAPPGAPDETRFSALRGATTVTDGIGHTNDLRAITSSMEIAGQGQLDLAVQEVNFDLVVTLTSPIDMANCNSLDKHVGNSIPFTLKGPVTEAVPLPDVGELVKSAVEDAVQERVQDAIRNRLEDLLR